MKHYMLPAICLFVHALLSGCDRNAGSGEAQHITTGVSEQLASSRKETIDKVTYDIALDIPNGKDAILATEKLTFELDDAASPVQLDFKEDRSLLKTLKVNGKQTAIDFRDEHILLPTTRLKTGKNTVEISLTCGDKALNRREDLLYSLFVPDRARTFVPCFDQPDLKAVFTLHATVPNDWEVVTNGPVRRLFTDGKRREYDFHPSDTISTYLFSVVAGKLKKETREIGGRTMHLYYRETNAEKIAESTDSIFSLHALSLKFMEEYTGIPYPFKKFDIVALPDFTYGGMEHVGAIDYRSDILFLDKTATQSERLERLNTIAHETAHMWFGDLVTMEWFNDVWMKEVFANFMAGKITQSVLPDLDDRMRFLLYNHPGAYAIDRTEGAHPIRQQLANLDNAGSLYGEIIYQKAPVVMGQLEQLCGKDRMREGLRRYLKQYAFGNASWPQLITILDAISDEDIEAWNRQWINSPGMPVLGYSLRTEKGAITELTIRQENGKTWNQHFHIALVYADSVKTLPVHTATATTVVRQARGLKAPLFIVFNSTGEGYGRFPADKTMLNRLDRLTPLLRSSVCLNAYENVLSGENITPDAFLRAYAARFAAENEEQIISRMVKQFKNVYWQFLTPEERKNLRGLAESSLLNAVRSTTFPGKKRMLFLAYVAVSQSREAIALVQDVWKTRKNSFGVALSDEDYITLAGALAIQMPEKAEEILAQQRKRIADADRRQRFDFVVPALSADAETRDRFFASLADKKNRENEVGVLEALGYLHHPMRLGQSEKYLPQTLELLEEIQATGDIFFPTDWLRISFGYYQSANAAKTVRTFLAKHPGYNPSLKQKVLQEADDLLRARKIIERKR